MNGETKYLYSWHDWGIYAVYPVEVVDDNYRDPRYPDEELALVRSPRINDGRKPGAVPKKNLFDTYEEADAYGRENTPAGAW